MWKEEAVKHFFGNFPGATEENHKTLKQDSQTNAGIVP
jgi:hypothetical protein